MKKYIYLLLILGMSNFILAQNLQFDYSIEATSETTRTLTFTASSTGAAETIAAGTWRLYYNSAKTEFTSGDATPLGSDGGTALYTFTPVAGTNAASPEADMYVDLNGFTFGGEKNIPDASPVEIFSIVMENVSEADDSDNTVYFVTTTEDPVVAYSGSGGSGIPISIGGEQEQLLPIKLSRFSATKGESSVNLDWSTSSEINGSHFDVQRSQNLSDWTTIGTVQAVGESSTEQNYNLVDKDLPLGKRSSQNFYYRLEMVDNDGTSELSDIRTVRFDQDGAEFIVYPNPSLNEVFVNLSSISEETGPAIMHMINMKGEKVKEVTLPTNDDINVDVSNLTSGVYYFVVKQGEETFTQKVIKID